jgi:hypothetical protein
VTWVGGFAWNSRESLQRAGGKPHGEFMISPSSTAT